MKAQVASVPRQNLGPTAPPVTVFDYDSGKSAPLPGPGLSMPTALISLGGGTNVFSGLKQTWTSVSWEQVVAADPQCIIIDDYGTPTAAQKEQFLETSPDHQEPDRCQEPLLPGTQLRRGHPGPRNAEAVVAIAHWLHPPPSASADGS